MNYDFKPITKDNEKPAVLLVDDMPENLFALEKVLKNVDANIVTSESGNDALVKTLHNDFALILLDVQMPDMNGYEVAKFLRMEENTKNIPIIFITAIDKDEKREIEGYDAGAVDFIFKPINTGVLLGKVNIFADLYRNKQKLKKIIYELDFKKTELENAVNESKRIELEKDRIHRKYLDISRKAGMAEVANGILHNVGNILNSVNISASLLYEKVGSFKITELKKAVDLIDKHSDNMPDFVASHPQGIHLAQFLRELSKCLKEEQDSAISEIVTITKNINHIKEIVSMQQSISGVVGITERCSIKEVMEDAVKIYYASFEKYKVKIVRVYADVPEIILDKHKLMQIIINLIINSKESLAEDKKPEKILTLHIKKTGEDFIRIEVFDNGLGIEKKNLTRIFSHGFTTKKGGHGFGLHSSALAAKEMGAFLIACSDGIGKGACFRFDIPIKKKKVEEKNG